MGLTTMKNNQQKKYHIKKSTLFIIIAGFSLVVSWFIFDQNFFKCKTILGSKICPSECKTFHLKGALSSEEKLPPTEYCVSDGKTKNRIGPFKVSVPKGWIFSRTQYTDRLTVEMSPPNEDIFEGKTHINIVYYAGTENEKLRQPMTQPKKKRKNPVFNSSLNIGKFKGQSYSYETEDNLEFYISRAVRERDVIQISSISPKGKISEMKKLIYERVVYSP